MASAKEDMFKVRSILDFVYLVQKIRGLSSMESITNFSLEKNQTKDKIIQFAASSPYKEDINPYLDILLDIDEKSNLETIAIVSEYTNLIINPLINKVIAALQSEMDTQTERYISLINLIEELGFKRGTLSFFANKNNEIPVDYIVSIMNRYGEFGKFIFDFIDGRDSLLNKNINTNFIHIKECFQILSKLIDNFINLEKSMLHDLSSYIAIEKNAIDLIEYSKANDLLANLSKREVCHLFQKGKLLKFSKSDTIPFIENTVYFCLKGRIKISKINIKGNEGIIDLCKQGDVFFSKFFTKDVAINTLSNDTLFFIMSEKIFKDIFHKNIQILDDFLKYQENYIIRKNNYFENLNCHEAKERLALFLIENDLAKKEENFDKASIAKFLNMRPETFSRVLKDITLEQSKNHRYLCSYCSNFADKPCSKYDCHLKPKSF
ncbi:MAG: Crp/Fnr family transcriptional regulator [Alphaproteobacteria bacterium]|nr:Crp/Fnr family transcriptional regulator [Alphaproteobacteria bacterium]